MDFQSGRVLEHFVYLLCLDGNSYFWECECNEGNQGGGLTVR